jgi:hypothetical protein
MHSHTHINTCTHICISSFTCMLTYTNEHVHADTHTHTHTHTYRSILIHAHLHLQIMLSMKCSLSYPSYHTDLLPYLAFFILLNLFLHFIVKVKILSSTLATWPHYKLAGCAVRVWGYVRWSDRSRAGECCSTVMRWEERGWDGMCCTVLCGMTCVCCVYAWCMGMYV